MYLSLKKPWSPVRSRRSEPEGMRDLSRFAGEVKCWLGNVACLKAIGQATNPG